MLGDEKSIDPEDVKDKLMTELILLNGASKDINQSCEAFFNWRIHYFWFFCSYGSASFAS